MSTTERITTASGPRTASSASQAVVPAQVADVTVPITGNGAQWLTRPEVNDILRRRVHYIRFKRVFDIVNSLLQLVLFSPVFLASILAIKLYDRGPVFFTQERITGGPGGPRRFRIVKFRTMVVNAEALGAKITEKSDPRITPFGAVLRKFKIDEMPQLINILRGEMTFVGPRPQTLGYVELFRDHYELIHSVVPAGLTDLASIRFRDEGGILSEADDPEQVYIEKIMPDKIRCHQEYVRRMNLALDMSILWHTILRVFVKR